MKDYQQIAQFLSISEFAARINVPAPTLRRWDSNGWLRPHQKSPTGTRFYTEKQAQDYLDKLAARPENLIDASTFAARIGVSPQTLRGYESKGYITPAYIGVNGRRYYTAQQIEDYLTQQ